MLESGGVQGWLVQVPVLLLLQFGDVTLEKGGIVKLGIILFILFNERFHEVDGDHRLRLFRDKRREASERVKKRLNLKQQNCWH